MYCFRYLYSRVTNDVSHSVIGLVRMKRNVGRVKGTLLPNVQHSLSWSNAREQRDLESDFG